MKSRMKVEDEFTVMDLKYQGRAAPVAQRFSAAYSSGRDPGDLGSSPTSGSLHGACFSLWLCLCLSLSVSLINKQIKSLKIKIELKKNF